MSSRHLAAAAMVVLLLAGCAGQPPVDPGPSGTPTVSPTVPPVEGSTPSQLVGMWRVSGAAGEEVETWLRIESGDSALWRPCGPLWFSWAGSGDHAVFSFYGYQEGCGYGELRPSAAWFDEVRSFRADDEGVTLLNADGVPVATLRDDGTVPPPHPNVADSERQPPVLAPEEAARLDAVPVPVPEGLEPATAAELVGRWIPADFDGPTDPFVEFRADGGWSGNDGCNEPGGAWIVAEGGLLLAAIGPTTLVGCEGVPTGSLVNQARRAALDGDRLVLLAPDGERLLELIRG